MNSKLKNWRNALIYFFVVGLVFYILTILLVHIGVFDHSRGYFYVTIFYSVFLFLPLIFIRFFENRILKIISYLILTLMILFLGLAVFRNGADSYHYVSGEKIDRYYLDTTTKSIPEESVINKRCGSFHDDLHFSPSVALDGGEGYWAAKRAHTDAWQKCRITFYRKDVGDVKFYLTQIEMLFSTAVLLPFTFIPGH